MATRSTRYMGKLLQIVQIYLQILNIRMGNSSLNQSVKAFEGEQLQNSLQTRLLRLHDDRFTLENDVRPAPPDKGSLTKRENLQSTKFDNRLDGLSKLEMDWMSRCCFIKKQKIDPPYRGPKVSANGDTELINLSLRLNLRRVVNRHTLDNDSASSSTLRCPV